VQRRSCGSVQVAFLDRNRAIAELSERARQLLERDSRVVAVGLFGSLARGEALPSSDADILIVLKSHPQPRWFDRIPEYADAFRGVTLPVEPFPYTLKELNRLVAQPGFLRTALGEMTPLVGASQIWTRIRSREAV